jgi:hypothetical protein
VPHPRLAPCRPRTLLAAVAAAVALGAAPAAAAPPANDTPETAIDLTSPTFTQEISIAEAGTEAPFDTKALRGECDREPVSGTVWYHFTATEDTSFEFVASTQEDWIAGVALIRDLPATRKEIALCGQEIIGGDAEAGDEFWLVAFARAENPTGTMTVSWDARPSLLEFSVDSITADRGTGTVTATGTYSCTASPFDFGEVSIAIYPGTRKIESDGVEITECTGETEPFTVELTAGRGRLSGPVDVSVSLFVCDDVSCDGQGVETTLRP